MSAFRILELTDECGTTLRTDVQGGEFISLTVDATDAAFEPKKEPVSISLNVDDIRELIIELKNLVIFVENNHGI